MKRSEAIRHIINVLRRTGNHYCDNGRDKTDAIKILERIEDIGMLPPMSKETIEQHNQSTVDAMLDSITYDFKWDKEDEKK